MPDDLNFANFRHVAEVFALGFSKQFGGIDFRHIEWRELPGRFARRRFLEDEIFVLIDVTRGLTSHILHRATSCSSASFILRTERSLSPTRPTPVSNIERGVSSVQHP